MIICNPFSVLLTAMSIVPDTRLQALNDSTLAAKTVRTYPSTVLLPPTRSSFRGAELEYAVCGTTPRFQRELTRVFPEQDPINIHVVPTIQRCKNDLVG